jgi:DNA invertase Pin-like site-specific DNA recombinase
VWQDLPREGNRRALLNLLKALAPGDVVTVTRIDRLARSIFDLFSIVKQIVDAKAQFRSLAEPWADSGTRTGRLMIAVLGGLADVERDLIRTRTAEGRSRDLSAFVGALDDPQAFVLGHCRHIAMKPRPIGVVRSI